MYHTGDAVCPDPIPFIALHTCSAHMHRPNYKQPERVRVEVWEQGG